MSTGMLILSFGLPLLLATVVMLLGWKLWKRPRHAKPHTWPPPVALGLGACLAFIIQEGMPSVPLSSKWHWILPTTFAVTVIGATHRTFPRRRSFRFIPELATAFIAAFVLRFPGQDSIETKLVIGLATLLCCMAGRAYLLRRPAVLMPAMSWLILAATALLVVQTNFAKLTIIAGAASMIAAAIGVCTLVRRPATISPGLSCVTGFLVIAIAACGSAYDIDDKVPMISWYLLAAAIPASAILTAMFSDLGHRRHWVITVATTLACCIAAVLWTVLSATGTDTDVPPLPY